MKILNIKKVLKKELQLEENFDYRKLYNDSRGAVHKDEYKALLKWCIKEEVIKISKYLVQESVHPDILYDIADRKGDGYYQLKEKLKNYHQENYYNVAPFIYLLEMTEPNYRLNNHRKEYEEPILEFPNNIKVGHRFNGTNAFSKLYFEDSKTAINSSNDNVENLVDTLEIDGITVYVVDVEDILRREQKIVVYKLQKSEIFNGLKKKAETRFLEELHKFDK